MKTRDLIAMLQKADPSGEEEVSVGNSDIYFVHTAPAYYDGCQQVLIRDNTEEVYFNITGVHIRGQGRKVVIHTYNTRELIWDDPKLPVTFDSEYAETHYARLVEAWRKEAAEFEIEMSKVAEKDSV